MRIEAIPIGKTPPDAATSITILLVENEGADRFALTPWILSHRIGHAVLESKDRGGSYWLISENVNKLFDIFNTVVNQTIRWMTQSTIHRDSFTDVTQIGRVNQFAKLVGTFRSARMGNLSNPGEFLVESFAQYLIQGKVTFQRPLMSDAGRTPPIDPSIDKDLLQIAQSYPRNRDGFVDEVLKKEKFFNKSSGFPREPEAYLSVSDASGKRFATLNLHAPSYRIKHYTDGGNTVTEVNPTTREINRYNKYLTRRNALINLYNQWSQADLIMPQSTPTDDMDDLLTRAERRFNTTLNDILGACVGKALVL